MAPPTDFRASVHAYLVQIGALKDGMTQQVTDTVRETASGVSRTLQAWQPTITRVAKRALLVYAASLLAVIVLCCTVLSCAALAAVSAGTLRYMLVVNAPGNQMHTLGINVMPLFTEPWRLASVQEEVTRFSVHSHAALPDVESDPSSKTTATVPRLSPAMEYLETEAAKMRLAFLSQYAQSVIGTSTLLIPPVTPRAVFSKDGSVDVDSLFSHPTPMFNGKGTYAAQIQLVFAKEDYGRDVSVVVESRMLYAEAAQKPQALHTLEVLFTKTHSAVVRTGERRGPWPFDMARRLLQLWFYVPMRLYGVAHYYLLESKDGMTFPPLLSDREVAVSLDLYSRFAPPTAVQSRLRALNVTVYQLLEVGDARLKLSRIHLFSMVQLSGLPYWLLQYPLISLVLLCSGFFTLYLSAACLFLLFGGLFLYIRCSGAGSAGSSTKKVDVNDELLDSHEAPEHDWESSPESEASQPTTMAMRSPVKKNQ